MVSLRHLKKVLGVNCVNHLLVSSLHINTEGGVFSFCAFFRPLVVFVSIWMVCNLELVCCRLKSSKEARRR